MLRLSYYSFFLSIWAGLISAAKPDYISDIRPILSDKCYKCHGPDANTRKAKLRLDQRTSILKVGSEELLHRVLSEDLEEQMPPPDSGLTLSVQEKDTLQQWIEAGLPWPEDDRHWAFIPPQRPKLPEVAFDWNIRNPIDLFAYQQLQSQNKLPAKEADKATLLRRAYDLTGLPPPLNRIHS